MPPFLLCLALAATPLAAQTPPPPVAPDTGRTDVLVLDHLFQTGLDDRPKVFLQKDAVYRAEFDYPGVQLELYTAPGSQPPYALVVDRELDPENRITYEIYPSADEDVEFRVIDGPSGGATHLKLFRDARATRHRSAVIHSPGWAIGLEVQAGLHTGYAGDTTLGTGGSSVEACLSFRAGPALNNDVSGCAFGIEFESNVSQFRLTYFFIEPRFRLFGARPVTGKAATEGGMLIRGALGSYAQTTGAATAPPDPKLLGVGMYVSRDVDKDEKGNGWSVQASVTENIAIGAGGDRVVGYKTATFTTIKIGVDHYF